MYRPPGIRLLMLCGLYVGIRGSAKCKCTKRVSLMQMACLVTWGHAGRGEPERKNEVPEFVLYFVLWNKEAELPARRPDGQNPLIFTQNIWLSPSRLTPAISNIMYCAVLSPTYPWIIFSAVTVDSSSSDGQYAAVLTAVVEHTSTT